MTSKLEVDLAPGLRLRNPVLVASGTFGYGAEYRDVVDVDRIGAVISKGITVHPRAGNPTPRIAETPSGMLNAIGLQNIGVQRVIEEMAPIWATWQVPVVVNISGESLDEFEYLASALDGVPGIAGLELNISCPNITRGGKLFADDAESAAAATRTVRRNTTLPLMVKLSPNVNDIVTIAQAVEAEGTDVISLINTFVAMRIDLERRRPLIANVTAGLSGPAIRPVAVRMVYQLAQAVSVPIVGIGGVCELADALEFLMAGASAVQVGTANFVNPRASTEIIDGLEHYVKEMGLSHLRDIVGAALPRREPSAARL
ncbi:MAG: dihydroorotate dehydrogenase [Chloroflexota bacterium]